MRSSPNFQHLLRSELESLPLPPRDSWRPKGQRSRGLGLIGGLFGAIVVIVILIGIENGLAARVAAPDNSGSALSPVPPRQTPTTTDGQTGRAPECPSGQSPLLEFSTHPSYPGATPQAALRSAYPTVGAVSTFPMEMGPTTWMWVVAGSDTFMAYPLADGGWVLYPARFLGCR